MFKNDIDLVREMVAKYGLMEPVLDAGGLKAKDITIADYDITIRTGDQKARYLHLDRNPFEDIAPGYTILNPEYGDPPIEQLAYIYPDHFGTIICLSVLEHIEDPFETFQAFRAMLKAGGLLILSTVFSFPKHAAPQDYWRFTDDCLNMLARGAGLEVLEFGPRLNIHAGMGVLEIHSHEPQEIRSVYIVARKSHIDVNI